LLSAPVVFRLILGRPWRDCVALARLEKTRATKKLKSFVVTLIMTVMIKRGWKQSNDKSTHHVIPNIRERTVEIVRKIGLYLFKTF
jgi:hypothetical protein